MRLLYLIINNYKNLKDFKINFEEEQRPSIVLGRNGSGKSNFFEAIVEIFVSLDLNKLTNFDYEINYLCNTQKVLIKQHGKTRIAFIDNKKVAISLITKCEEGTNRKKYLPKHIFAYYSGQSNRLESYFVKHEEDYKKELLKGNDQSLRKFIFAKSLYSQFIILAFLAFDDENARTFLKDYIGIKEIDSVEFVLKNPSWKGPPDGDQRFWNSAGIVADYLGEIAKIALLVEDEPKIKRYWFKSEDDFKLFANKCGDNTELFKIIESIYISDLLANIIVRVNMYNDEKLTFDQLSEGEQQLLTVIGMLRFAGYDESLFLLDEPETHLNPVWKQSYTDLLSEYISIHKSTHTIITTHDPLVISNLDKEQIRVFEKNSQEGYINVFEPSIDPKGLGVEGILTSDIYGLRSGLDLDTQKKLEEKRKSYIASLDNEMTEEERSKLRTFSSELSGMEFSRTTIDLMYDDFIRAMVKTDYYKNPVLSSKEIKDRDEYALNIIQRLMRENEK